MKKYQIFEVLLIILIIFSHSYAATRSEASLMNWFRTDDAFYYFNTAKNISNGLGVTFDGINSTNGFHPLWMLVCIPIFSLAKFDLYLPFRILIILMGVLNTATAILIYRWLSNNLSKAAGVLGAIIWAFSPSIHSLTSENGIETGLSVFFLILLLYLVSEFSNTAERIPSKKLLLTGIIASLAFLSRLDNVFIILMLGIWFVFKDSRIRIFLTLDLLFIFLAAFLSFLLRLGSSIDFYTFLPGFLIFLGLGFIVKILLFYFLGLYQPTKPASLSLLLKKTAFAVFVGEIISTLPILVYGQFNNEFSFPRSVPVIDFAISFFLISGVRLLANFLSTNHTETHINPLQLLRDNWKIWIRRISYYFGILFITGIGYAIYNLVYFLTAFPVSGQIKQWWGTLYTVYGRPAKGTIEMLGLGNRQWDFLSSLISSPSQFLPSRIYPYFYLIIISIIVYLLFRNFEIIKKSINHLLLIPILGGCFWQIWTYTIRSYAGYRSWYWVSQLIFSFLCCLLIIQLLIMTIKKPIIQKIVVYASIVIIGVTIFTGYVTQIMGLVNYNYTGLDEGNYLFLPYSLESNTEPGAIIGLTGGGSTGYFIKDRTIVNLDGLINSYFYFQALKNLKTGEFLDNMGLDYVLAKPYIIMESDPYQLEFPDRLGFIKNIDTYTLYRFQAAP